MMKRKHFMEKGRNACFLCIAGLIATLAACGKIKSLTKKQDAKPHCTEAPSVSSKTYTRSHWSQDQSWTMEHLIFGVDGQATYQMKGGTGDVENQRVRESTVAFSQDDNCLELDSFAGLSDRETGSFVVSVDGCKLADPKTLDNFYWDQCSYE